MNNISIGRLASVACLLAAALHMTPAAAHHVYDCTATNTAPNAGIVGDVEVQSGASCTLSGVSMVGDVTADEGSTLTIENSSHIQGTVTVNAANFSITGSAILGHLVIAQAAPRTVPPSVSAQLVCNNTIQGPVTIENVGVQPGAPGYEISLGSTTTGTCPGNVIYGSVSVQDNAVPVNVESNASFSTVTVSGNTATPTSAFIENNTVAGPLKCSGNTALMGIGTNHESHATGQCVGF